MRIGTFLLGGLVGAAAVVYFTDKKNRSMMFSAIASPTDSLSKLFGVSKEKAYEAVLGGAAAGSSAKAGSGNAKTGAAAGTAASTASAAGKDGLAQVEKIVNEDPELKRTVNEILSDNNKAAATLQ